MSDSLQPHAVHGILQASILEWVEPFASPGDRPNPGIKPRSPLVYPVWDSLGFMDAHGYFLPHYMEIFDYYFLKYFLMPFLFVVFFWDIYDLNVGTFNIVPRSLRLSFFILIRG